MALPCHRVSSHSTARTAQPLTTLGSLQHWEIQLLPWTFVSPVPGILPSLPNTSTALHTPGTQPHTCLQKPAPERPPGGAAVPLVALAPPWKPTPDRHGAPIPWGEQLGRQVTLKLLEVPSACPAPCPALAADQSWPALGAARENHVSEASSYLDGPWAGAAPGPGMVELVGGGLHPLS